MSKPNIFIGCSEPNKQIAKGLELNLNDLGNCNSWFRPNVIGVSDFVLDQLIRTANSSDFAIFILGEDDLAEIKGESKYIPRDNVLIELGLFIGKIGRERVFFIIPEKNNLHIPSDLNGVIYSKYLNTNDKINNTKNCCNHIELAIENVLTKEESNINENIKAVRFYEKTRNFLQKTGLKLIELGMSVEDIQNFVKDYTDHVSHIQFKKELPPLHPNEKTEYKDGTIMKCGICRDEVEITGKRRCPHCKLDLFAWIGTDPK